MSKSLRYLNDGEDFGSSHFGDNKDFGFTGSAEASQGYDSPDVPTKGPNSGMETTPQFAKGGDVHPQGHQVSHTEDHGDGSFTAYHKHGGFTHHHANGGVTHHDAMGMQMKARGGAAFDPHNSHMHDESEVAHRAQGGMIGDTAHTFAGGGDVAQDKAMVKKGIRQHEEHDHKGEPRTDIELARGGRHPRLPRNMRPHAAHAHPIGEEKPAFNRPPRNPMQSTTPKNSMPGGVMPYGVEPSDEPEMPAAGGGMRRGGMRR